MMKQQDYEIHKPRRSGPVADIRPCLKACCQKWEKLFSFVRDRMLGNVKDIPPTIVFPGDKALKIMSQTAPSISSGGLVMWQ
jgi:hypothetical protein